MLCLFAIFFWILSSLFVALMLKVQKRLENKPSFFEGDDFPIIVFGPLTIFIYMIVLLCIFLGKKLSYFLDKSSDKVCKVIKKMKEIGEED